MPHSSQSMPARGQIAFLCILIIIFALGAANAPAASAAPIAPIDGPGTIPNPPAWLEPRGVNVVDLVGVVPEDVLRDSIVVYAPGNALAYYQSGQRSGDTVTVRVRFASAGNVGATCLGMPGHFDAWPSVMPAGTLRIMAGSTDVTRNIGQSFDLVPAGPIQPIGNTSEVLSRYPRTRVTAQFDASGALILPANMGCQIYLPGGGTALTGIFTMQTPLLVSATVLGSQDLQFRSYIGPGYSGDLAGLQEQMSSKYSNRHDDLRINPPSGAEFVWVKYPETIAPWNPAWPAAGTYRIRRSNAKLSVDHENTMAIPLFGQFQDADQSPGTKFLPYFTDSVAVSSPEYFVPTGIPFNPCMTTGNCPDSLLEQIYNARMDMTVYYLRLERVQAGLTQIPLAQVGPAWTPGSQPSAADASAGAGSGSAGATAAPGAAEQDANLYLPIINKTQRIEPDNPTGCPCGWFADDGRMLDLVQPK